MMKQRWRVDYWDDNPGFAHISPVDDTFPHRLESDGECWCGAWKEDVDGGVIVHHLNLTERLSKIVMREGQHAEET